MLSNIENPQKEDLRIWKTEQALITAMFSLLKEHKFIELTVDNICKTAHIGRATFYAHFTDRYGLLKFWLSSFYPYELEKFDTYEDIEKCVNQFVCEYGTILFNVFADADEKIFEILTDFLCSTLGVKIEKYVDGEINHKYIVISNMFVGGIVNYFLWQVKNMFPSNVPIMNKHFFDAILKLQEWEQEMR